MAEIHYRKSSPDESTRWAAYLTRRTQTVWDASPLRRGLKLAMFPAFGAQRCWTVEYPHRAQDRCRAEMVTCEVEGDYQRFLATSADDQGSLTPVIVRSSHAIEYATVGELELVLSEAVVPLSTEDGPVGTDGESFRLERRAVMSSVSVRWWEHGPKNWDAAVGCFRSAWRILDAAAGLAAGRP